MPPGPAGPAILAQSLDHPVEPRPRGAGRPRAPTRMRICFLSTKHTPLDKRVFAKEAVSLARAGHEVLHLAPAGIGDGSGSAGPGELTQGVQIITFPPAEGLPGRLLHLPKVYRRAAALAAECYHCNEPDSWMIGILLKLRQGSRVVFDVHEQYSTQFADDHSPAWLRAPVGWLIRRLFRLCARFTDRLVFAKESLAGDFAGARTKSVVVHNFASIAGLESGSGETDPPRPTAGRAITAIHIGLFSRVRGWPQLLEAMRTTAPPELRIHVVGSFVDDSGDAFVERCAELGLGGRVVVEGWLPQGEVARRLRAADVGLVLFQPGMLNYVYSLPHKLFDYMLAGLPVLAPSGTVDIARVVRQSDCGLVVDSRDPGQIGEALARLASDPGERRRLGANGRRAVLERYNWEAEFRKLAALYRELESEAGRPASRA